MDYDYDDNDEKIVCKNYKEYIYTVYSKDDSGIKLLNKAFKSKEKAYEYALNKVKKLLDIINDEFKYAILPIPAQLIYVLFKQKEFSIFKQYEYFRQNYIDFFKHILKEPIMFFVSELQLVY